MNEVSALMKETAESSPALSAECGHGGDGHL